MVIRAFRPRPTCEVQISIEEADVLKPTIRLDEVRVSLWFNHWPPTDNGQARFGRGGWGRRPNLAVGHFKELVRWAALNYRVPRLAGWRVVQFHHVFASRVHGDPSNYIKVTQDALQYAGILENDRYAHARVESTHYPWDPNPPAGGWKIGMGVVISKADASTVGTPRPKDWKPERPWQDPAPSNQR